MVTHMLGRFHYCTALKLLSEHKHTTKHHLESARAVTGD